MNGNIHFIITGGTIDSVFSPEADSIVVNDHSVIADYIKNIIKPNIEITHEVLTLKDSRAITDNIRKEIVGAISKSPSSSIVVTHGTYTMVETAKFLKQHLKDETKTVILTGSMFPLKGFSESDATYNLGYAISAAQLMKPGVYVAMNSNVFEPEKVQKDIKKAKFVNV